MKKTMRRISSFALALLMMIGLAATAFAATPTITFNGFADGFEFAPGSDYTRTDLFGSFKGVMPGDVLTETITFRNNSEDSDFVQLYMRAEAHDKEKNPLSEGVAEAETVDSMTELLSRLSMRVWNGTELIYEASPDTTDTLTENRYLGTFRRGETGNLKVELTVPPELSNDFADRVGEVDWIFHVEAFNESQLSVRKVWSDGNANHTEDSVKINLLKDGEIAQTVELNAENGWAHTFDRLVESYKWSVEEAEVPKGYTVSYETVGTAVTITNTADTPITPPAEPLNIIAKKLWSNDNAKNRPSYVTITLYNGNEDYETVKLSDENNWTYHWEDLSAEGNWQVVETNIPSGYIPSYSVSGNVVTINNTHKLIQTGQLNWPIMVLGGAGIALVALGGAMLISRKKKNNNA